GQTYRTPHYLFPWVGIGEIRDHVEINRYGLLRLINITYQLANGTMEELTELRNMVMQNRVILDFLTAPQGGVCKIIGPTCCTFVPDETALKCQTAKLIHISVLLLNALINCVIY
uniref:ERVV2 protein n=1 Tax=Xiphophorus maculatus TaxID=8083 RepID=A0A3B5QU83_XIPMA